MTRRSKIEGERNALAAGIAKGEDDLRAALIEGADTAPDRGTLARQRTKLARLVELLAAEQEQAAVDEAAAINAAAANIAAEVCARIDNVLTDLQPPAAPSVAF